MSEILSVRGGVVLADDDSAINAHVAELIAAQAAKYRGSVEFALLVQSEIAASLGKSIERLVAIDRSATVQVLAAALESLGAGVPAGAAYAKHLRSDAAFWADSATPREIEAYVAAGLQAVERTAFCVAARKRILATMYASLTDADRMEFLARVDPKGQFRARKLA